MTRRRWVFTLAAWAGLALLAAIAVASQLTIRRDVQLWEIDKAYQEVVYLQPGGSVSQRIDTQIGDVTGFAALVRPSNSQRPASVNMRIRRPGADRPIIRESRQHTIGPHHQGLAAIPLPPIPSSDGSSFEFEIELAADSPGGIVILGSINLDEIPPRQLTINGALTLPNLRALVSPIISVSTWSLIKGMFGFNATRSAMYLLAIAVLSATGIAFGRLTLRCVSGASTRALPFIALFPITVALILAVATVTFTEQFGRDYRLALTETYWNTGLAYSWFISISGVAAWRLSMLAQRHPSFDPTWRARLRPANLWQPLVIVAVATLALSVGFVLLELDGVGNVAGALAEILFGLALILGIGTSIRSSE